MRSETLTLCLFKGVEKKQGVGETLFPVLEGNVSGKNHGENWRR